MTFDVEFQLDDKTFTLNETSAAAAEAAAQRAEAAAIIAEQAGLSADVKEALLQIAQKVAYIDEHGQDYYDDLYDAFYPPAGLDSISAVYTQSGTVYDTDTLDSLKDDLVVTAHYSDQTTAIVTTYTLSGTLAEGTSTITVAFGGMTTTFNVTVIHNDSSIINWDFTQSLVDSKQGLTATLGGSATQDSSGVHINKASDFVTLGTILASGRYFEIDIADMDVASWTTGHGRLFIWYKGNGSGVIYRSDGYWTIYASAWKVPTDKISAKDYFKNSTVKIEPYKNGSTYNVKVYKDNVLLFDLSANYDVVTSSQVAYLGGGGATGAFKMTITGFRVYEV